MTDKDIFYFRCHAAVIENPSREIGEIYKEVRNKFTQNLNEDERRLFLEDISDKESLRPQLYRRRMELRPAEPMNFVSTIFYFSFFGLIPLGT